MASLGLYFGGIPALQLQVQAHRVDPGEVLGHLSNLLSPRGSAVVGFAKDSCVNPKYWFSFRPFLDVKMLASEIEFIQISLLVVWPSIFCRKRIEIAGDHFPRVRCRQQGWGLRPDRWTLSRARAAPAASLLRLMILVRWVLKPR